jgi:heme/copper-type cytochrome/quinol oxidase subunit 2
MLPLEDQFRGGLRLLEVDNYLVLPINVSQRILVTSTDVIHSWAVPAFGIKVDGVPGRLNQVSFYGTRCGVWI